MYKKLLPLLFGLAPLCAAFADLVIDEDTVILTAAPVNIDGNLTVNANYSLSILPPAALVDVTITGAVINNGPGTLQIGESAGPVNNLNIGGAFFAETLSRTNLFANSITFGGAVTVGGQLATFNAFADGDINLYNMTVSAGGNTVMLVAGGSITTTGGAADGFIRNQSARTMNITAGGLNVAGTLENTSPSGVMNLNIGGNLAVTGGDANNASLVTTGNFNAIVVGDSVFLWGIDHWGAGVGRTFSLTTGTLAVGESNTEFTQSALANFNLTLTSGALSAGNIYSGRNNNGTSAINRNSNMQIDAAGGINASGHVINFADNAGASMRLTSAAGIAVLGNTVNWGTMWMSAGTALNLNNVENRGSMILSSDNAINISGPFTAMTFSNTNLSANNITFSDAVTIGGQLANFNATAENNISMRNMTVASGNTANLTAGGTIATTGGAADGFIRNQSARTMNIAAGGLNVAGTLENSNPSGLMNLNIAGDMTVSGGNASNASLVTTGNFNAVVSGNSNFLWGIDHWGAGAARTFSLTTGTLTVGGGPEFTQSALASFNLQLTGGALVTGNIYSGRNADSIATNRNSYMRIDAAGGITASGYVINYADNISVLDSFGAAPPARAAMWLTSAANITVSGDTVNYGNMWMSSGTALDLNYVENSGFMRLMSDGTMTISGDILAQSNRAIPAWCGGNGIRCDLFIDSVANLNIGGTVTNLGGWSFIMTDATMAIGQGIDMTGGRLDMMAGTQMNIAGAINQTGGILNMWGPAISTVGITNSAGAMNLFTDSLTVGGNLTGSDGITINPFLVGTGSVSATVNGTVSGAVAWNRLSSLTINNGDYIFGSGSSLIIVVPDDAGRGTIDTGSGDITNGSAGPIIQINSGRFVYDVNKQAAINNANLMGVMGIQLTDYVTPGDAIWLVNATGGIDETDMNLRNLAVELCNNTGTMCMDYVSLIRSPGGTNNPLEPHLPILLSISANDIYIVFDNRFGGPQDIFSMQPTAAGPDITRGEIESLGALDAMLAGAFNRHGWTRVQPMDFVPLLFEGTIFDTMANELYARMLYFEGDPSSSQILSNFAGLFQPRELDLVAASMIMNEKTAGRALQNRMLEEFTCHRHLNKVWGDVSADIWESRPADSNRITGNRFSAAGGIDIQNTDHTIFGLMGHVSHTSGKVGDMADLSYGAVEEDGFVDVDVSNLHIGVGAYMLNRFSQDMRMYGRLNLNVDLFDISREQTFMAPITGSGTAISVISEWGLLHNIYLQHFVGNAYARIGYNFGLDITESAAGERYMHIRHDGHFILTPGYEFIAQRRVYMSALTFLRPYVSVGVEYDVAGIDNIQYKFETATRLTDYAIDTDPIWTTVRAGFEVASMTGLSMGLEAEYRHNEFIRIIGGRAKASLRF